MSGADGRTPVTVPATQSLGKRTGEARQFQPRAEPTVWTARMLAALEQGVRGGKWHSLIDKLYPITTLRAAFAAVSANDGAAGVDHVTIERYANELDANLERLSVALRNGTYRPQAQEILRGGAKANEGSPTASMGKDSGRVYAASPSRHV